MSTTSTKSTPSNLSSLVSMKCLKTEHLVEIGLISYYDKRNSTLSVLILSFFQVKTNMIPHIVYGFTLTIPPSTFIGIIAI